MSAWRYRYVGTMLAAYRHAFATVRAGRSIRMDWACPGLDLAGFRRWFCDALDRRINLKVGDAPPWRKLGDDYQRALLRDQRRVREWFARRVIVRQFETDEARRRFGHILYREAA